MPHDRPSRSLRPQIAAAAFLGLVTLALGAPKCGEPVLNAQEQHGRELYLRMCAVCHGPNGEGYRADEAPAIANRAFLSIATDEMIRAAIADGRRGTTMSAWSNLRGGPLNRADLDAVVAYLRSWGRRSPAPLDERPNRGDAARGTEIYARECARCHGDKGVGGPYEHIGEPQLLGMVTNGFLREVIRNGRAPTAMPGFAASLGDAGVEDLIALIRSWQATSPGAAGLPWAHAAPLPLGPVPLFPKGPEPEGFRPQPATTPAAVVKEQLDRGAKMALLDARAPSDYINEHIAGAVSVPFYDPTPYISSLPKDAWLVSYCACPHAESGQLAQKLVAAGFKKVTILDEGLGVWRARKYGTHKGDQP